MIQFTTAGGVTGHEETTLIDPKKLPLAKLEEIQKQLDGVKFFDIKEKDLIASPPQPDSIFYEIKVEVEGLASHTVKIDDSVLFKPEIAVETRDRLLSLIDIFQEIAIQQRQGPQP